MIDNLTASVMKQRDPDLVRDGAPSLLLLIDGMVEGSPHDADTLMAAARLYSAYASAFVLDKDQDRTKILSRKARDYAFTALSLRNKTFAQFYDKPFAQFQNVLTMLQPGDEEPLFLVISTWASYIQAHRDNWDNLADIAKVEALAKRLLELDETYYFGSGRLVLGILKTFLPEALGGQIKQARAHFEQAIEISKGTFLPAYVMYAKQYARLTFDRPLHDRLLHKVLETPADVVPELTLINTIAQKQAQKLLAEADEYF